MSCSGDGGFSCRCTLTIRRISSWSESKCSKWLKDHCVVARKAVCCKSLHALPRHLELVGRTWSVILMEPVEYRKADMPIPNIMYRRPPSNRIDFGAKWPNPCYWGSAEKGPNPCYWGVYYWGGLR